MIIAHNRKFSGIWIPAEIWLENGLNALEKILLVEIDSLDNQQGCIAGNDYFAGFLGVTTVRVSQMIKKLKEDGYIYEESFDGRIRTLKSNIKIVTKQSKDNYKAGLKEIIKEDKENDKSGLKEIIKQDKENDKAGLKEIINNNNTINNTINNPSNNIDVKKEKFKKPSIEELIDFCNQNLLNVDPKHFIDFYNSNGWKVGKNSMKDWQATARNWHRRNAEKITTTKKSNKIDPMDFVPSYDYEF